MLLLAQHVNIIIGKKNPGFHLVALFYSRDSLAMILHFPSVHHLYLIIVMKVTAVKSWHGSFSRSLKVA